MAECKKQSFELKCVTKLKDYVPQHHWGKAHAPSPESDAGPERKATMMMPSSLEMQKINGEVYQFPVDKPLYSAHSKWEWENGYDIISGNPGTSLGCMFSATCHSSHSHIDISLFQMSLRAT